MKLDNRVTQLLLIDAKEAELGKLVEDGFVPFNPSTGDYGWERIIVTRKYRLHEDITHDAVGYAPVQRPGTTGRDGSLICKYRAILKPLTKGGVAPGTRRRVLADFKQVIEKYFTIVEQFNIPG